jgi:monoamine oxidase
MLQGLTAASSNSTLQGGANANQDFDVVIIGAGWSGLGAAKTLLNEGVSNFLVLEASDTIGGRCKTVTVNDGMTVEVGCQWIHRTSTKNPLYNIVKQSGIPTKEAGWDNEAHYSNVYGGTYPHQVSEEVPDDEYDDFINDFLTKAKNSADYDQSLRKIADRYIEEEELEGKKRLRLEYFLDSEVSQPNAASLEDLSFKWQV